MPPKKVVELNVVLIDANSTANAVSPATGSTHFDVAEKIADSILCQKIFADSTDKCALIAFGFDRPAHGCYVINEMERANFFAIEKLEEVKPGTSANVPVQKGLQFAINQIKEFCEENPNNNFKSTIYLLSNLDSTPAATLTESLAHKVAKELTKDDIQLIVGSPDEVINDEKSPKIKFMGILGAEADAKWLSFSQCQNRFDPILLKSVAPRGMPFDLKLDKSINIKLQMYTKNTKALLKHSFALCSSDGKEEVKKHFQHTTRPDIQIGMEDVDMIEDSEIVEGKFKKTEENKKVLDKEDLIKAFYYGKTAVPTDDDLKREFQDEKIGKELRLIQFTSRDNILPQFFMTTPRYLLPVKDTYGSQKVMQSLVKELLDKNLVAIVRYAYNVNSSARIVCLIPKITKSGLPLFIHYQIPYGDDTRTYEFAYLDTEENQPDDFQTDAIEAFVDDMMLPDDAFRPKDTPNMRLQNEALILRQKALDPGDPIAPYQFSERSMQKSCIPKEKYELAEILEPFNLQPVEDKRSKVFGNRPMGVDPIDFHEDIDENVKSLAKKEE